MMGLQKPDLGLRKDLAQVQLLTGVIDVSANCRFCRDPAPGNA
jgi:hypothetical protein